MFKPLALTLLVLVTAGFQIQKRLCDHPAPPEGMHYVCAPQNACDCHLEKDAVENEAPATASPAQNQPCSADKVTYFVVPAYPESARRAGKQATVTARLTIESSGAAHVEIESGDAALVESVRTAVAKWRFAPSAAGETLTATFTFTLAGNPGGPAATVSGASPLKLVISAPPPLR